MRSRTMFLLAALVATGALWVASRSRRGQLGVAATLEDPLEFITVTAQRIGEAVNTALLPRGIRNGNPGNIRWIADPQRRWNGMLRDDGGNYAVFELDQDNWRRPVMGVRAIGRQLLKYEREGATTVRAIINRWAPPIENNTSAYVIAVARALGVPDNVAIDVNGMLPQLALAIIRHENGQQPYDPADIAAWVRL